MFILEQAILSVEVFEVSEVFEVLGSLKVFLSYFLFVICYNTTNILPIKFLSNLNK